MVMLKVRSLAAPIRSCCQEPESLTEAWNSYVASTGLVPRDALSVTNKLLTRSRHYKYQSRLESQTADKKRLVSRSVIILYRKKRVRGLALPPSVLRKIFHENAVKWFPGILGKSQ
jgi:hypothetical protein